jgi:hypothetical protein
VLSIPAIGKSAGLAIGKSAGLAIGKSAGLAIGKSAGLAIGKSAEPMIPHGRYPTPSKGTVRPRPGSQGDLGRSSPRM